VAIPSQSMGNQRLSHCPRNHELRGDQRNHHELDAAEGDRALRLTGARDVGVHGGPGAQEDGDYVAP
jgi:hypothetical protein